MSDAASGLHCPLAGLRVMVVDDSRTIRWIAERILHRAGCEVILAHDGFEALGKVALERPEVILMDIVMPRLDGYQTRSLVRQNALHQNTPIIMVSARDTLFERAKCLLAGWDAHLAKPYTKETLLPVIAAQARAAASQGRGSTPTALRRAYSE